MLHVVNYSHRTVQLSKDISIPPRSVRDIDMGYTSMMVNLCRSGIIKVTDSQNCDCNNSNNANTADQYAARIQSAMANDTSSIN